MSVREAFAILVSRIVLEILLVAGVVGLILGRARRRLRVSPTQTTRAPVLWLVNFTADARLHRRIRSLAAVARRRGRAHPDDRRSAGRRLAKHVALDLERELVGLDDRLVASARLDTDAQRAVLRALRPEVDRVEALLDRVDLVIEQGTTDPSVTDLANSLDELEARVERLEQATRPGTVINASGRPQPPPKLAGEALDSAS